MRKTLDASIAAPNMGAKICSRAAAGDRRDAYFISDDNERTNMETNLMPSYETVSRTDDTPPTSRTMHAVRAHVRGGPEGLVYERVPIPTLQPDDALISVRAVGITPGEFQWNVWETPEGASRLPLTPGHEVAGVVAAVGPAVIDLTVGTAVYALAAFSRDGAAAESVAVRAADLAPKPQSLSFAEAAATPLSALTAWQALIAHGGLRGGRRRHVRGPDRPVARRVCHR
jgi:hypothetical protein